MESFNNEANDNPSFKMRPNKTDNYEGKRNFLSVQTWIYKIEQYLLLIQASQPDCQMTDTNRIMFATTFLAKTAAIWWYTVV